MWFDETTEKSHNIDYIIQFMRNVENPEWMIDIVKSMRDENIRLKGRIEAMVKQIATFEKISYGTFRESLMSFVKSLDVLKVGFARLHFDISSDAINKAYEISNIPKRKTKGSAGYDFICPFDVVLIPGQEIVIPTGIKCRMDDGWVLKVYPRSGLGFKYRCRLANTVGVIDADYYNNPDNEGHILIKIVNEGNKKMELHAGDSFAQGIFSEFGITTNDNVEDSRVGGIGSTGR